jgi:hypothetical protein
MNTIKKYNYLLYIIILNYSIKYNYLLYIMILNTSIKYIYAFIQYYELLPEITKTQYRIWTGKINKSPHNIYTDKQSDYEVLWRVSTYNPIHPQADTKLKTYYKR